LIDVSTRVVVVTGTYQLVWPALVASPMMYGAANAAVVMEVVAVLENLKGI